MDTDRVGLYVKPKTRDRLNLFKARLAIKVGRVQSQDDALNYLLDHFQEEKGGDRHRHNHSVAQGG